MSSTGKNIVICCDGTGNQLGETYSNVIKLYTCLAKDNKRQMVFYDPGVGTMSDPNVVTPWSRMISKIGGMAFGWGLKRNVTEAYAYLMENYEVGDTVYMYGFSRGAYSVRVLAALIHTVGLLQKGTQHLIPYAWETFRKCVRPRVYPIARQFKATYGREVDIHFMGVWDTVTSFGIFNRIKLPYTTNNPSVKNIRHAVAIDERRTYYRQNLFGNVPGQDIKQVWFAGAHSDVGGSYNLKESGLSQLSLEWMIAESVPFNVHFDTAKVKTLLYDGNNNGDSPPDFNEAIHHSLSGFWWPLEFVPKWRRRWPQVYIPFGRSRNMYVDYQGNPLVPTIHESVLSKIKTGKYFPRNFDGSNPHILEERLIID